MSLSGPSQTTGVVVGILCVAAAALVCWSVYALWGEMDAWRLQRQLDGVYLAARSYCSSNKGFCPDDPALIAGYPSGSDFVYLGKGMRMDLKAKRGQNGSDSLARAFPLICAKIPKTSSSYLTLYSDGRCESYDSLPKFLPAAPSAPGKP